MFKLTANNGFISSFTEEIIADGVLQIKLNASRAEGADKLELCLEWESDDISVNAVWNPCNYRNKSVRPNWAGAYGSAAMSNAPVLCNVAYDDTNRLTIACSDAKNHVDIRSGVVEESAKLINTVKINVECAISSYECIVRVDTRAIPFYKCVQDVAKWWETFGEYAPAGVPDTAREPLYSAWYSFHQQVDVEKIVEECRFFSELGCKSLIVDDGWQTDNNERGYAYCGDWQPTPVKVPDMKAFVDAVHSTGLKFVLWYSVPFVGKYSNAYERFKDKMLGQAMRDTFTLDPRYPDVREYLINLYRNAMLDWGLDGFKLDFIDSFRQSNEVKDGMDFVSVYDAVDRLMKDVLAALREINPDVLIEFRQSYMGPLMRSFGNMIRVGDCPNDSLSNRLGALALRLTSGGTAVHSDMVMWNYGEPVELAAFQLTNVLFAVPQISVRHDLMPADHSEMVKNYLTFWKKYRNVLLDGELFMKDYASDYTYVSALLGETQVGAVYAGRIASVVKQTDEIVLVNASMEREIFVEAGFGGKYEYTVNDCRGNEISKGTAILGGPLVKIPVPVNGTLTMTKA